MLIAITSSELITSTTEGMWYTALCTAALVSPPCSRQSLQLPGAVSFEKHKAVLLKHEPLPVPVPVPVPSSLCFVTGPTSEAGATPLTATRLVMRRGDVLRAMLLSTCMFGHGSALPAFAAEAPAACVDVDSASAKDLESLKGVGPVMSKRIIDYRKNERTAATKDGRKTWNFDNWATLMRVEGVGQQICADNIAQVCFGSKVQKACPAPK